MRTRKISYSREQKINPTGNYREYLVNICNYILEDPKLNGTGWSKASTMYIKENLIMCDMNLLMNGEHIQSKS